MNQNKYRIWLFVLFIGAVLFQIIQLDGEWTVIDGDDVQYVLHANSLIKNGRYNDPNFVYWERVTFTPISYPPGWPLLLIPIVFIFGKQLVALKIWVVLLALLSGFILYKGLIVKSRNSRLSLLMTGIYLFSMMTIVYSRIIYSEWPYMVLGFFLIQFLITEKWHRFNWIQWVGIGLGLGFLLLIRSAALAFILAVIAVIVHEKMITGKEWKTGLKWIAILLLVVVCLYKGIYWIVQAETSTAYISHFRAKNVVFPMDGEASLWDILLRVPKNILLFINRLMPFLLGRSWHESVAYLFPHFMRNLKLVLFSSGLVMTFFVILGFIQEARKKHPFIEYYVFFYIGMVTINWTHKEIYRLFMPIAPFILYYFIMGVTTGLKFILKCEKKVFRIRWILAVVILFITICQAGLEIYRYKFSSQNAKTTFLPYKKTVQWLKDNVKSGEIIIADDPRWYVWETERPVTIFQHTRNPEMGFDYIRSLSNPVIVYDPMRFIGKTCFYPILQNYSDHFYLVQTIGHIQIYRYQ